jgi:uncharacterized damage-inducible protein DinB
VSDLIDHARSILAYNHWANGKVLDAASGLSADAYRQVRDTMAHFVGTQMYWYANWHATEAEEPSGDISFDAMRALFDKSDAALADYASKLTDDEWNRSEAWWKRWGIDAEAPVGPMIFQVIYHGIQHRAEVAMTLTQHGCSPGDLDYLVFLQESAAT